MVRGLPVCPGLPRYLDSGMGPDNRRFLRYLRVPGQTLRELSAGGGVRGDDWFMIAGDLLQLLVCLHLQTPPVFHGDLSANNIIIDGRLQVGVIDFGVARSRALSFALRLPARLSTAAPRYLSPEQAAGHAWGGASDVFQAGLSLLELWLGRPANPATTPLAALELVREAPAFARAWLPALPQGARALLGPMLAPVAADRPGAAALLAQSRRVGQKSMQGSR